MLPRSNARFELSAAAMLNDATTPRVRKDFAVAHSDLAFFDKVLARFDGHWPLPLRQALGGALGGHTMERLVRHRPRAARIALDARIEINCPVTTASSPRGSHLDTPNLFRWKDGPAPSIDAYELPPDSVDCVAPFPIGRTSWCSFRTESTPSMA